MFHSVSLRYDNWLCITESFRSCFKFSSVTIVGFLPRWSRGRRLPEEIEPAIVHRLNRCDPLLSFNYVWWFLHIFANFGRKGRSSKKNASSDKSGAQACKGRIRFPMLISVARLFCHHWKQDTPPPVMSQPARSKALFLKQLVGLKSSASAWDYKFWSSQ